MDSVEQSHLEGRTSAAKVSPDLKRFLLGYTVAVMLAAFTAILSVRDVWAGEGKVSQDPPPYDQIPKEEVKPDIQKQQNFTEPYSQVAPSEAILETGTLQVRVTDMASGLAINGIKVYFYKTKPMERGEKGITKGLGFTNILGVYRIERIPVGKYFIEVGRDSEYGFYFKRLEIIANKENVLSCQLQKKTPK